jgi:Tol biopolymer transport system component
MIRRLFTACALAPLLVGACAEMDEAELAAIGEEADITIGNDIDVGPIGPIDPPIFELAIGRIAFQQMWSIRSMWANGTDNVEISASGTTPSYETGREHIVYSKSGNIYIADGDGDNARAITSDPDGEISPALSPDGKKVAFATEGTAGYGSDIYIINVPASGTVAKAQWKQVVEGTGRWVFEPKFHPLGTSLVFNHSTSPSTGYMAIGWVSTSAQAVTPASASVTSLGTGYYPAFSPDGMLLAFAKNDGGDMDIFTRNMGDGTITRLPCSTNSADDQFPTFNKTGSKIAFTSKRTFYAGGVEQNPWGAFNVYTAPIGSSTVTRLTSLTSGYGVLRLSWK